MLTFDDAGLPLVADSKGVDLVEEQRVWVEEGADWRLSRPDENRKCRHPRCGKAAVVALKRDLRRKGGFRWWHYCAEHCYGRRVEGGKVLRGVHPDSPAAKRGGLQC